MLRCIDDLVGATYDILKFIIRSISYLFAGMIIVAAPMYLIVWISGFFSKMMGCLRKKNPSILS